MSETISLRCARTPFDPGVGLKKRKAEGYLAVTSRRLILATTRLGILINLALKELTGLPRSTTSSRWLDSPSALTELGETLMSSPGTRLTRRVQGVIATSSASFSDGFMYPSVLRGRSLSRAAILARSLAL